MNAPTIPDTLAIHLAPVSDPHAWGAITEQDGPVGNFRLVGKRDDWRTPGDLAVNIIPDAFGPKWANTQETS